MKYRLFLYGLFLTWFWACVASCGDPSSSVTPNNGGAHDDDLTDSGSNMDNPNSSDNVGKDSETDTNNPANGDEPPCEGDGWGRVYPPHGSARIDLLARANDHTAVISRSDGSVSLVDVQTGDWRGLPPLSQSAHSLGAVSPKEIYAMNSSGVFLFDGAAWQDLEFPEPGAVFEVFPEAVFSPDGTIAATGADRNIWVRQQGQWSKLTAVPHCPSHYSADVVWHLWGTGPSDLYVGLACDCFKTEPGCLTVYEPHVRLLYWNGKTWSIADPTWCKPITEALSLAVAGEGEVFTLSLGENRGKTLRHYVNGVRKPAPNLPPGSFETISCDSQGTLFLSSGYTASNGLQAALYRGGKWEQFRLPGGYVSSASLALRDGVFLVGEEHGGLSLFQQNGAWTSLNGSASDEWTDVFASKNTGVVIIGHNGNVLRGKGRQWTSTVVEEGDVELNAVTGTRGGALLIGGMHFVETPDGIFSAGGLWCAEPQGNLHEVDLTSIPGDEDIQIAWAEDRCGAVHDVAAAPNAEVFYALCNDRWLITLDVCEPRTVELLDLEYAIISAMAASKNDQLYIGTRDRLWLRYIDGTWHKTDVDEEDGIVDLWRAPDTGEMMSLEISGQVRGWKTRKLLPESPLPAWRGYFIGGFSSSDIYLLGQDSALDISYLAHFDGSEWKSAQTLPGHGGFLGGVSPEDLYLALYNGEVYRGCRNLF